MPHTRQGQDNPARTQPLVITAHRANAHVAGTAHANQAHANHDDSGDIDQGYEVIQGLRPGEGTDVGSGAGSSRLGIHGTGQHHADNQSYHPADNGTDPRVQRPNLIAQDQD